jgi:hypothetical protein
VRTVDEGGVREASVQNAREAALPAEPLGAPHIPEFVHNISSQRPLIRRGNADSRCQTGTAAAAADHVSTG